MATVWDMTRYEHYPSHHHQNITTISTNNRYHKDKPGYRNYGNFSQSQTRNRVVGQRRNHNQYLYRQPFVKQTQYRKFKTVNQSNRVGTFGGMEQANVKKPVKDLEIRTQNDSLDLSQQQMLVVNTDSKIAVVGNVPPNRCSNRSRSYQRNSTTGQDETCIQGNVEFHRSQSSTGGEGGGLLYEDITENSDEHDDAVADLRECLLRRKHEQIAKREQEAEPGEIESDEERNDKRKTRGQPNNDHDKKAKLRKIEDSRANSSPKHKDRENSRPSSARSGTHRVAERSNGGGGVKTRRASDSSYSCYDDRYKRRKSFEKQSYATTEPGKAKCKEPCTPGCHSPRVVHCAETELANIKELLRETRNKLLEEKVTGSKKATRMEDEVRELKSQLETASKREEDLKATIKKLEDDIGANRIQLTKMSVLYEIERHDKTKFDQEITRIYQERLTVEVEKLRALFDIEIAKMQTYYVSPTNSFDDNLKRELSISNHQSVQHKADFVNTKNPTAAGGNSHQALPSGRNLYDMAPVNGNSTLYKNFHLNPNYSTGNNNLHLQNFSSSPSSPSGDNTINSSAAGYLLGTNTPNIPTTSSLCAQRFSN